MSLDMFSPARAPETRRDFEAEYEPLPCRSLLYTANGTEPGPRRCAVSHAETGEVEHGSLVGTVWTRWTDAMAAESQRLLLEAFAGWECLACGRPCYRQGRRGCCSAACELAEYPVDDREDAEVDA